MESQYLTESSKARKRDLKSSHSLLFWNTKMIQRKKTFVKNSASHAVDRWYQVLFFSFYWSSIKLVSLADRYVLTAAHCINDKLWEFLLIWRLLKSQEEYRFQNRRSAWRTRLHKGHRLRKLRSSCWLWHRESRCAFRVLASESLPRHRFDQAKLKGRVH